MNEFTYRLGEGKEHGLNSSFKSWPEDLNKANIYIISSTLPYTSCFFSQKILDLSLGKTKTCNPVELQGSCLQVASFLSLCFHHLHRTSSFQIFNYKERLVFLLLAKIISNNIWLYMDAKFMINSISLVLSSSKNQLTL